MKYAVIQLAGKQYKVSVGDELIINKLEGNAEDEIVVNDVLLVADDADVQIGTPLVEGAKVTLKIVDQHRGDKIRVAKYKAKSRYRKVFGHRQHETTVKVTAI